MTKGDEYTKKVIQKILDEGCLDENPRPHYADGTPAHTLSINHEALTYDLSKGENPLITLRPIAIKSAVGELLWIYRDQSNDLDLLKDKYGITWWDDWAVGKTHTIGACYGETVRRHDLMNSFMRELKDNPDGRRHIINMWQVDDFKEPHGLKPCAYQTVWNVRHGKDGIDYLDMCLFQRSSDFMVAGCINQVQYVTFLYLMAKEFGYKPGRFTWFVDNVQIYDRHIFQAMELLDRDSVDCNPSIEIDDNVNWENVMPENVHVTGYPRELIKKKNPQMKFDLGI